MVFGFILPFLLALLVSMGFGVFFTVISMKVGMLLGIVDLPGGRRTHETPTPRTGGLAIFFGFHLTLLILERLLYAENLPSTSFSQWYFSVMLGSILVFITGLFDDRLDVAPGVKLLGQLVAAVFTWIVGIRIGTLIGIPLPLSLDLLFTVLLFLAAMNAYNLIDGMDGVAAGLGAITAVGLAGLNILMGNPEMTATALAVAGVCLGFLRFNFHPAKIFLGDTGSMLIGYLLVAIALGSHARGAAAVLLVIPLLTMGVPLIDTALAIWRRSVRKALSGSGKVTQGDRDHLHHRLARKGLTQARVAVLLYAVQAGVLGIGMLWVFQQNYRLAIFTLAFFAGSYVLLRYLATLEMSDSGRWIVDGLRKPGRRRLISSLMPVWDMCILSAGFVATHWAGRSLFIQTSFIRLFREVAPLVVCGTVIIFWAARFYRPMWRRARAVEYFNFCLLSVGAILSSFSFTPFARYHNIQETLVFGMVYLFTTLPFLLGLRVFPRLCQDLFHLHLRTSGEEDTRGVPRSLIYGAGYGYTLHNQAESFEDSSSRRNYHLVGLIDDDPLLQHLRIHGHEVLGDLHDLPDLIDREQIDEIIVTTTLRPDNHTRLMRIAEERNLTVLLSQLRRETLYKPPVS